MKNLKAEALTKENGTELTGVKITIPDSETGEVITITLDSTSQVGNFSCPDIEGKGLLEFVPAKLIYQTVLQETVNGSRQAIELNLKNVKAQIEEEADVAELEKLAKLICLSYQTQAIPLFGFVTGFDFENFQPTRCDVCKKCTYKRRCIYYSAPAEQAEECTAEQISSTDTDNETNNI